MDTCSPVPVEEMEEARHWTHRSCAARSRVTATAAAAAEAAAGA